MKRAALAAVIGALVLVAGCSGAGNRGSTGGYVSANGQITRVAPADRKPAPTLEGKDLDGKPITSETYAGKVLVVNVWGSWCPPCRKEAPDLQAAATELGTKAAFVGINTRDDTGQALAYERRFKVTYPSLVDDGDLLLSLRGAVTSQSPPITIVLDDKGRVAGRFIGPVTRGTLVDMVGDVTATG